MAPSSVAADSSSSRSLLTRIGLSIATWLVAAVPALAQVDQATAALGIGANHGTLSFAPWEQIDSFTGNVLVFLTDIDLPGDSGFNLTIRRFYNSKSFFSPSFDYGFPSLGTTSGSPGVVYPVIEMPDGSRMRTLQDATDPTLYLTTSRWRVRVPTSNANRTIETPHGVRYVYDLDNHPLYKEDAFGNRIVVVPEPGAPSWRIGSLVQYHGADVMRTVSIGYDPTTGMVSTLTANGRTWTYTWVAGTSTATDPTGATWTASWAPSPKILPFLLATRGGWKRRFDSGTPGSPTSRWRPCSSATRP